jgi:hypothetical protein
MADYFLMPPPATWPLMTSGIGSAIQLQPSLFWGRLMLDGAFTECVKVLMEKGAPGTGQPDDYPENYQPQIRLLTVPTLPKVGGIVNAWHVNPVFLAP